MRRLASIIVKSFGCFSVILDPLALPNGVSGSSLNVRALKYKNVAITSQSLLEFS